MESGNKQGLLAMIKSKSVDFIENVVISFAVYLFKLIYWLFFDTNTYVIKAWNKAKKLGKEYEFLTIMIQHRVNSKRDDT